MTEGELQKLREAGRLYFGKRGDSQPNLIRYLDEVDGFVPWTWWPSDEVGHTDEAAKEMRSIFGSQTVFDTAKPVRLLRRIVEIAVPKGGLVLDFFAGSGTIGHAVAAQNAEDGHDRQYIAVQLPEKSSGANYESIADITLARLKYVIENVEGAEENGLRAFRLAASNFRDSSSADAEDLFDMRESTLDDGDYLLEELAAEVLLKEGIPLDAAWARDKVGDATVVTADGVAVVMSLEITEEIANGAMALGPRVLVFLEDGFAGRDAVKANAFTNAKSLAITMKTI